MQNRGIQSIKCELELIILVFMWQWRIQPLCIESIDMEIAVYIET